MNDNNVTHPVQFVRDTGSVRVSAVAARLAGIVCRAASMLALMSGLVHAAEIAPVTFQPSSLPYAGAGPGASSGSASSSGVAAGDVSAACPSTPTPTAPPTLNLSMPELQELARSLKYDPNLLYEYVHNAVQTLPLHDSQKGPIGAILDGQGSAIDQAELLALLMRSGPAPLNAMVEYGQRTFTSADIANWLGTDLAQGIALLVKGHFPASTPSGTTVSIRWAWVKVTIGSTVTYYDPAFKTYARSTGLGKATLLANMGYNATNFLTRAEAGATKQFYTPPGASTASTIPSVQNLNYTNTQADLTTMSTNFVTALRAAQPAASTRDIIGGSDIIPLDHADAIGTTTAPGTAPVDYDPTAPSGPTAIPYRTQLGFMLQPTDAASPDQVWTSVNSSDLVGRSLYLFVNASNQLELWLDGKRLAVKPEAISGVYDVSYRVCHFGIDQTADWPGVNNPQDVAILRLRNLTPKMTFNVVNTWGGVGRGSVERQRRLLQAARAGIPVPGNTPFMPLVRSLATLGSAWAAEYTQLGSIIDQAAGTATVDLGVVGLVGLTPQASTGPAQYTPYFDLPFKTATSVTQQTTSSVNGVVDAPQAAATLSRGFASMLESATLEQTQPGLEAASALKMLALASQPAASNANSTTVLDLNNNPDQNSVTCNQSVAYYQNTLQSILSANGYLPTPDLTFINTWVGGISPKCTPSGFTRDYRIILPVRGNLQLGGWPGPTPGLSGSTYWAFSQGGPGLGTYLSGAVDNGAGATPASVISGGSATGQAQTDSGGGGSLVTATPGTGAAGAGFSPGSTAPGNAGLNFNTVITNNTAPSDPSQATLGAGSGQGAVGRQQGNYTYASSDISIGSGGFPYQLTLTRTYDSNQFRQDGPFPLPGWSYTLIQRALQDSDMFELLGVNSPISGAAGIVAIYTAFDVLQQGAVPSTGKKTTPLDRILVQAQIGLWLERQAINNVVTVTASGTSERFVRLPDGSFNRPMHSSSSLAQFDPNATQGPGIPIVLHPQQKVCPAGTLYQYVAKTQQATCFNATGNVTQWSDPDGMYVTWTYDDITGLLASISNRIGRALTFAYNSAGKISSVSDNATGSIHTASYARDGATGDLVFTGPDGQQTRYSFDLTGHMTRVKPPTFTTAAPQVVVGYDALDRAATLTDALGHVTGLLVAGNRTETVDNLGHSVVAYYDPRGNAISSLDDLGNLTSYAYDGRSRLTSQLLPEGNSFAYTYDDLDNLLREDDTAKPGSGLAVRSALFTYDPAFNHKTVAQDFDGRTTQWNISSTTGLTTAEIDQAPLSNTPAVTSCLGQSSNAPTTCVTYNSFGKPTQIVDPIGKVTKYAYGPSPNYNLITSTEDAGSSPHLNITTTYSYDNVGNLISVSDPYSKTTGYAYDPNRRLTSVDIPYDTSIGAPRRPMTIGRDAYGRVTCIRWQTNTVIPSWLSTTDCTITDQSGATATGAAQTTATTYTATGQVAKQTDASARVVNYGYDALDRTLYARDGTGKVVSWSYDFNSRLAQVCKGFAAINTAAVCAGQTVVEKRNYTANGLLHDIQHFSGGAWNPTTYLPDGFDRAGAQVIYPDTSKELRTWSAAGDLKTFTSRSGSATSYTYDALHRQISRSGSWSASYGYDLASHPLSVGVNTAADGVAAGTWYWGYDSAGRVISEVQPNISTLPVRYELDLNGLRDSTFWPDGAEYYLADNYSYVRIRGDLTLPSQSTKTLWKSFPDPFDQATNLNLLPSTTIYAQRAFDAGGGGLDIASVTNGPAGGPTLNYTYTYDAAHRLSKQNVANAAPLEHPATTNTLAGLTANKNNQLLNTADPNHVLSYDSNGNLVADGPLSGTSLTINGTHQYTYATDGSGRMLTATTKGGSSASYSYDPFGRRIAKTVGGVTTRFLFDAAGREIGEYDNSKNLLRRLLWHPDFTAPLAFASASGSITYQATDRLGSVVATYSSSGALTNTYSYLPYGDTASGTISGTAFGYAGYRYDSETATYHTATRSYDPRLGRFLQTDPIGQNGGTNIYAYAGGDPLGGTDPSGLDYEASVTSDQTSPAAVDPDAQNGAFNQPDMGFGPNNLGLNVSGFQNHGGVGSGSHGNPGGSGSSGMNGGAGGPGRGTSSGGLGSVPPVMASLPTFNPGAVTDPLAQGLLRYQGVQIACLEDACIGEAAIAAMVLGTGAAITAQQNQQTILHGNSLDSQRQTYVYQLINRTTGDILKYGITSQLNPQARYPSTFYEQNNAQMQVITSYSNRGFARAHELGLTGGYFLQNGALPPLSSVP